MFDFMKKEKINEKDVGLIEDMTQFLMHLCCLEFHSKMSFHKTQNKKFLELHDLARDIRQKWLPIILKENPEAEEWCIIKHFLTCIPAGEECANRLFSDEKKDLGEQMEKDVGILIGAMYTISEK